MSKKEKNIEQYKTKTLAEMFAKIEYDKEYLAVIMQRGDWEALHYMIGLALKKQKDANTT